MILTDGFIDDLQSTINKIVELSNLPISIVIVGVGDHNFEMTETLDADYKPLWCNMLQKHMEDDIVNFVPI